MSAGVRPVRLGAGWVLAAPDWVKTSNRALEKRPAALTAGLALNASVAAPPVNITCILPGRRDASAAETLDAFLSGFVERTPGVQIEDRAPMRFDDGAPGVAATAVFEPMPGLATVQLHAARKWRGDLVHLVATLAGRDRRTHEGEVRAILSSYAATAPRA